jgi:hypothetical protein
VTPIIFPTLAGVPWIEVNLDKAAAEELPATGPNPANDPKFCAEWIDSVAYRKGGGFTFGGYGEVRQHLWRGHYHNPDVMRHLGVDCNVPAGTLVAVPADCEVIRTVKSTDQNGGWGGLIFFRLQRAYLDADYFLYGHLAHAGLPAVGKTFSRGDIVARIGEPHENGGWFSHLHAQCFNRAIHRLHTPNLEEMDGYGPNSRTNSPETPDPTGLICGSLSGFAVRA